MLTSAPLFSADVLKKCALIALHVIAEEGRGGEDGCHAPGLGDEWKVGCPKGPMWESEGEACSEDGSVSSSGSREGTVCNDALHVIGLQWAWWQDLSLDGLGAGKGGPLPHGPGQCQEMHEARLGAAERPAVTAWTGCDS